MTAEKEQSGQTGSLLEKGKNSWLGRKKTLEKRKRETERRESSNKTSDSHKFAVRLN